MYIQPRKLPKFELYSVMDKTKIEINFSLYFSLEYNPSLNSDNYTRNYLLKHKSNSLSVPKLLFTYKIWHFNDIWIGLR